MRFVVSTLALLFLFSVHAAAGQLPRAEGRVLLTVSGEVSNANSSAGAEFDQDMLSNLDWQEIRSFTAYTDGEQVFAGPTLASVLQAVGATGETIKATAVNDYTVSIPVSDAAEHGVILAMNQNGRAMRLRDKGPIWVIYPMTEQEAADRLYDAEMIWQLDRIAVE